MKPVIRYRSQLLFVRATNQVVSFESDRHRRPHLSCGLPGGPQLNTYEYTTDESGFAQMGARVKVRGIPSAGYKRSLVISPQDYPRYPARWQGEFFDSRSTHLSMRSMSRHAKRAQAAALAAVRSQAR